MAVLPHASVAINVLVRVYSLAQVPGVVASVNVNEAEPQPSLAVGEENTGVAGQKIVALAPTPLMAG